MASASVAEFRAEESNGDKISGAVRLVGLVVGPPVDADKTEPWMHVEVKIDGLAPTTEYCVELHEYGDIRYSRGWPVNPVVRCSICPRELCSEFTLIVNGAMPGKVQHRQEACGVAA